MLPCKPIVIIVIIIYIVIIIINAAADAIVCQLKMNKNESQVIFWKLVKTRGVKVVRKIWL